MVQPEGSAISRSEVIMNKYDSVLKKYGDIINLPHPTSANHPQMSMHDRAAQFSPFAALTGHSSAISETAKRSELERADELDRDPNDPTC